MAEEKSKKTWEARDIYNLSLEEIDAIQEARNTADTLTIESAYQQRRINDEERHLLLKYFHDGMGACREVYRALYETLGQPENTCSFDLLTGKVDTDNSGRPINYGLKVVTPFVNTRLEYQDKNNNPIFVVFPKMKSVERAIEKLESEYGKEYSDAMSQALEQIFKTDDREAFAESLQNIPKTTTKLRDIYRLTITCKYLSDVERMKRKLTENKSGYFHIDPNETRNRFDKPLSENPKQYYDIKQIMHITGQDGNNFDVEVQLKINSTYQGDIRTHKLYEEVRKQQALLNQKNMLSPIAKRQLQAKIDILNNRICRMNENAIHEYNMMVLDKARRIEDDGYRPLRITPEYADGTYKRCRNFIADEYLVESYKPFNGKEAFASTNETNQLCFLRMLEALPPDFDEFSPQASEQIRRRFSKLTPAQINRFNGINEVAERYQSIVQHKINDRQAHDQQTLQKAAAQSNQVKSVTKPQLNTLLIAQKTSKRI